MASIHNIVSSSSVPSQPATPTGGKVSAHANDFLQTLHDALTGVSAEQAVAATAEDAVAAGTPGASMATALVLSDKAEVAWNAVVAVRNEVVSAYQTLTNMQI